MHLFGLFWFETADRSVRIAAAAKRRASCSRASEIQFAPSCSDGNGRDDVSVGRAITELLRSAAMLAVWRSSQCMSGAGSPLPRGQLVPIGLADQPGANLHHEVAMSFEINLGLTSQRLKE